jgi:predicted transcriptional regulator
VTRDRMLAVARLGPDSPLWTVMQRDFPTLKPSESANEALEPMGTAQYDVAPVLRDGHLVGMLSAEDFHNVIALDQALASYGDLKQPADGGILSRSKRGWLRGPEPET